jgi:anti-sigma factor RsiW
MIVDELLLLAYVDGELPSEQREEVEAALAHSPELAAQAAALRASRLPYQSAFDRKVMPPIPENLTKRIAELSSVSAGNAGGTPLHSRHRQERQWRSLRIPLAMAASFMAGIVFHFAATGIWQSSADIAWMQAVATYQDLYVRDTIASVDADKPATQKLLADIREHDGMALEVPDLRSEGMEFKRLQRLSFDHHALIQMVYLPQHGDPIALCILDTTTGSALLKKAKIGTMHTVSWEKNGMAYLLLGKDNDAVLTRIGEQLRQARIPPLLG